MRVWILFHISLLFPGSRLHLALLSSPFHSLCQTIAGPTVLHGPHHSAQKSTRTGFLDLSTISSQVSAVTWIIFLVSFLIKFDLLLFYLNAIVWHYNMSHWYQSTIV